MRSQPPLLPNLPAEVKKHFQRNPLSFLLPLERDALSASEREALTQPLCSAPAGLASLAPWIGFVPNCEGPIAEFRPAVVGVGICLPELRHLRHWAAWNLRGPTLEYVIALESAAAVANQLGASLKVLMADNEFLRDAHRSGGKTILSDACALADSVAHRIARAYPQASIIRTTTPEVRGSVSSFLEEAALYPSGVARPWGRPSRDLWTQLDYLGNVGLFNWLTREGNALLMIDHDQCRSALAATRASRNRLAIGLYWPLPASDWPGFGGSTPTFPAAGKSAAHLHRRPAIMQMLNHRPGTAPPRRMHRSIGGKGWLYVDAAENELEVISPETRAEIAAYVDQNMPISPVFAAPLRELQQKLARIQTTAQSQQPA